MERIPIWGEKIPYNSTNSKFADMQIDFKKKNKLLAMLRLLGSGLCGDAYQDSSCVLDTWTYLAEIRPGYGKETYEDVPYLMPFLVPGSKRTILVVPGGGFCYKQSDLDGVGKQTEGDLVARELNRHGISAFVLWYRTNPYRFPVPLLDMQRAVRFLRFHAAEYGIDPDKISAIGFSAGGYEIAGLMNILRGQNPFPTDYIADEVDSVSDKLETAGLFYPCVSFENLMPTLNGCFSKEQIDSEEKRGALCRQYSCVENFCATDTPQFFAYGGKDTVIPPSHEEAYIEKLEQTNTNHQILFLPNAQHGFGFQPKKLTKKGSWMKTYIDWYNAHT